MLQNPSRSDADKWNQLLKDVLNAGVNGMKLSWRPRRGCLKGVQKTGVSLHNIQNDWKMIEK